MIKWNKEKRLLSQQQSKFWKYELKDVDEPNLFKDIFPYSEVGRIVFDNKIIPISPPEEIFITDTTFRDGQ
ncbi:MAG: histone-lysine N-methyltransferase, partial [Smithellaceae bacterium]